MKNQLMIICMAFLPYSALTQSVCDNLIVTNLQYSAFNPSQILVYCENNNVGELFGYPGFILRNAQGDSIAGEQVTFFGIGEEHVSSLSTIPGTAPILENFTGTLELWTNFYENQACIFNIDEPLCPTSTCNSINLLIMNTGGAMVVENFSYMLTPIQGGQSFSGNLNLTNNEQMAEVQLCVPNGEYELTINSSMWPLSGQIMAQIYEPNAVMVSTLTTNFINQTGSALLNVPVFANCIEGPNSTNNVLKENMLSILRSDHVTLIQTHGKTGRLTVIDVSGRVLIDKTTNGEPTTLPNLRGLVTVVFDQLTGPRQAIRLLLSE